MMKAIRSLPGVVLPLRDVLLCGFLSSQVPSKTIRSFSEQSSLSSSFEDLKSRIFKLRFPKRSATNALQTWVSEGRTVTLPELRLLAKELYQSQRYKHALEISEWMVTHSEFKLIDRDYALRIDLVTKVFGCSSAEESFNGLPQAAKTCETYTALLHSYAVAKQTEMAEKLFEEMKESCSSINVLTYNEMMTLYLSSGQFDKVPDVISEIKRRTIPLDLFSYNCWASSHAAIFDIDSLNNILHEMMLCECKDDSWTIYVDMVRIYLRTSRLVKISERSLVGSEGSIVPGEWITYDFLFFLYAALARVDRIDEIWKSLRNMPQKMTSRSYLAVLLAYLVMGRLQETKNVVDQCRENKHFDYGECRRLSEALMEVGMLDKARLLNNVLVEKDLKSLESVTLDLDPVS